jgi:DNA-directed RNA polymerase subunit RPC12/RpoP
MSKKTFKCFTCGKVYNSEAEAVKCHDAPVQRLVKDEKRKKPRFLGN